MEITLRELQEYIRAKDHNPARRHAYMLKLVEEMGELAEAVRREKTPATMEAFRGTVEEELFDVLYYTLALANLYEIDLTQWVLVKERYNDEKYGTQHAEKLIK